MGPFGSYMCEHPPKPYLHTQLRILLTSWGHSHALMFYQRFGLLHMRFSYEPIHTTVEKFSVHLAHNIHVALDIQSWKWTENGSVRDIYEMARFSEILIHIYVYAHAPAHACTHSWCSLCFILVHTSNKLLLNVWLQTIMSLNAMFVYMHEKTCVYVRTISKFVALSHRGLNTIARVNH
mgnify:CR=1 FL=1